MGKATIIEAQNSNTVFENGSNKGILGKLKGVFADYKHGTRNADRLYSEELWDNRVFGSEDVMEALETKTLFGELDHPEGDRCETLAKNAAISITKLEKRPEEGVIYGEAEILDTPTGRIVKALADSGAKLGVSSRGMGEEIFVDGQNIIDPETYDFITFDVVVTPANTKARVELTESKHISKLTESLKKEINDCETENQVNQIKTVVESVNITNKDEINTLIENKLKSFDIAEIPAKLTEANKSIAIKLLKQKFDESKAQLEEALKTSAELAEENARLVERNEFLEDSRTALKSKLRKSKNSNNSNMTELNSLTENVNKLSEENTRLQKELNDVKAENFKQINKLNKQQLTETNNHKEMLLRAKQIANRKVENAQITHNKEVEALKEALAERDKQLAERDTKINNLVESNKSKQEKLNKCAKVIFENKKLKAENLKLTEANKTSQTKLTESKLQETKKIRELEAKVSALTEANRKMEETQDRFAKMSFDPLGTVKAVAENFNTGDYDQDDIDLFNMLTGNK